MVHSILRAYCLSLIKACDFVHQRIYKETYYEVLSYQDLPILVMGLIAHRKKTMSQISTIDLSSLVSTLETSTLS